MLDAAKLIGRIMFRLFFVLTILSSIGCSVAGLPPSLERRQEINGQLQNKLPEEIKYKTNDERYYASYHYALARLDGEGAVEACRRLEKLGYTKGFRIHEMALVHFVEKCSMNRNQLKKALKTGKSISANWIHKRLLNAIVGFARKNGASDLAAEATLGLIPFAVNEADKEKMLLTAKKYATKDGSPTLIRKVNERIKKEIPRYQDKITSSNILSVARSFEKAREFKRARELYQQVLDKKYSLKSKSKAYYRYAMTYKLERDLEQYNKVLQEAYYFFKAENSDYYAADFGIKYARGVWTLNDTNVARQFLFELLDGAGVRLTDTQSSLIMWIISAMYLEEKDYTNADKWLSDAQEIGVTGQSNRASIYWGRAWNHYLNGYFEKARDAFKLYLKKVDRKSSRVKFWLAMSYRQLNDEDEAEDIFEELYKKEPFTYYGIISKHKLGTPYGPLKTNYLDEKISLPTFEWLLVFNEHESIKDYLEYSLDKIKSKVSSRGMLELLKAYNMNDLLIRFYYSHIRAVKLNQNEAATYLYPAPFKKAITEASERFGVHKNLILSIIRQESIFNTNARSWADAFGLMQLLPERAVDLSAQYGIPYEGMYELYLPKKNIMFGTALLKNLGEEFDGNFIGNVAGYNASTKAVRHWMENRFTDDPFESIENIPYRETQKYVKLVMRNFVIYERFETDHPFGLFDIVDLK